MEQQTATYPQLRLDFYNTAVLMSRWQDNGRIVTYPVSIHDVVTACTHVEMSSGLLPANTLFWKQKANQPMLAIYVPARRWKVQTEDSIYHIPMPPFVFVGCGAAYQIFAVKKRPSNEHARLYHVPCPNVHTSGSICQGNTPFPICSAETIQQAVHLFMAGSLFNVDLSQNKCNSHPEDVRELWSELNGRKRFPLSELAATNMRLQNLF